MELLPKCRSGLLLRIPFRRDPVRPHRAKHYLPKGLFLGHCYGSIVADTLLHLSYS